MLGASISKEKVKKLNSATFICHLQFATFTSVLWLIKQPICYAVIPLWFLILISLFDSTVVTKENLHLKNNWKLTAMSVSNENENQPLMKWLTYNWNTT